MKKLRVLLGFVLSLVIGFIECMPMSLAKSNEPVPYKTLKLEENVDVNGENGWYGSFGKAKEGVRVFIATRYAITDAGQLHIKDNTVYRDGNKELPTIGVGLHVDKSRRNTTIFKVISKPTCIKQLGFKSYSLEDKDSDYVDKIYQLKYKAVQSGSGYIVVECKVGKVKQRYGIPIKVDDCDIIYKVDSAKFTYKSSPIIHVGAIKKGTSRKVGMAGYKKEHDITLSVTPTVKLKLKHDKFKYASVKYKSGYLEIKGSKKGEQTVKMELSGKTYLGTTQKLNFYLQYKVV